MVLCHETQLQGQMGMGKGISLRRLDSHLEKAKVVVLGRRTKKKKKGFPGWLGGKGSTCQCRRHGLDPWSGEITNAAGNSACVPQVLSLCSRARELQALSPRALGSVLPTREATAVRSLCTPTREPPTSALQLEKSPHRNQDPTQPKRKQINKVIKKTTKRSRKKILKKSTAFFKIHSSLYLEKPY